MAEYLIKHTGMPEEYYLKSVQSEHGEDPKRGEKWKKENRDKKIPKGSSTATWVKDEQFARYFQSRKEAENMIKSHPVLRFAQVIEVCNKLKGGKTGAKENRAAG